MATVHRALVAPVRTIVRHLRLTSAHEKVVQIQGKTEFTAKVLSSDKPVVVDFHANWCGPCRELGPRLEAAAEKAGIELVKVDVDEHTNLAMEYDVTAVPTVLAVSEGKVTDRLVGSQDDSEVTKFLKKLTDTTK